MPRIIFISHDGEAQAVDLSNGLSLMEGALHNGIAGIDADCGGSCACGTCRVVVDPAWRDMVGEPGEVEEMMLEMAPLPLDGARLSCQIVVTAQLEGLVVTVPEAQFR